MTALHWMVHGGTKAHEEGVEALLRAGADATISARARRARARRRGTWRSRSPTASTGGTCCECWTRTMGGEGRRAVEGDGEL